MNLSDINLDGLGKFETAPACFTVTEYDLKRSWGYIYTTDDILLKLHHNGCGYAQINPPSGIMLFKQERYEILPSFFAWFQEDTGFAFSNFFKPHTGHPIELKPDYYECTFRPAFATYKLKVNDWKVETKLAITPNKPVIMMRICITNTGLPRKLRICPLWRPHNTKPDLALWDIPELYQSCKFFNDNGVGIIVETRDPAGCIDNRKYTAMLTDLTVSKAELRYDEFIGSGSYSNPQMLYEDDWLIKNNKKFALNDFRGDDAVISQLPIAVFSSEFIEFKTEQTLEFNIVLKHFSESSIAELYPAVESAQEYLSKSSWFNSISRQNNFLQEWMGSFQVETPDRVLNRYINEWLPLQLYWVSKLDRGWPTGMRGTRDAAQDYSGISYLKPELGRKILKGIFECQRNDGWFPRQFSTSGPEGKHDLREYIDGGCWVFELLNDYLSLSGDLGFLNEKVRWRNSNEKDTVKEHSKRIFEYYFDPKNIGEHGLVIIRGGDWNDSMNSVGLLGVGESVMVSCHLVFLINAALEVLKDDKCFCEKVIKYAKDLKENLRKNALNNSGFLNGVYTDNHSWLFSDKDPDGFERINGAVNSFGMIAGIFESNELSKLLEKIDSLKGPNGYRLFYPPLGLQPIPLIGRIGSGDLYPGTAENGTVYNHGSQGFLIRALASIGEGNRALEVLRYVFSYDQKLHPVKVSKTEPYGVINCWNEINGKYGEGEKVFLTGTISTVFRAIYSGILGFKPQLDGKVLIKPCLPDSWNKVLYEIVYRGQKLSVAIFRKTDRKSLDITINGVKYES